MVLEANLVDPQDDGYVLDLIESLWWLVVDKWAQPKLVIMIERSFH